MPDNEEPLFRPDGHRYEAPESDDDMRSKSVGYAVLGILVLILLILIATGTVQVFSF